MTTPHHCWRYTLDDGLLVYEAWDTSTRSPSASERHAIAGLLFRGIPRRLASDPRLESTIARILHEVRSFGGNIHEPIGDAFARLVGQGRIGLREVERNWRPLVNQAGPTDSPTSDDPIRGIPWLLERKWIEVRVHDRDGAPLVGLDYRLELPDGEATVGTLGDDAKIRVEEIAGAGSCRLTFPRLADYVRPLTTAMLPTADSETRIHYRQDQVRSLALDTVHRVVIAPPQPQPSISYRGTIFGRGSAFPTVTITSMLGAAQEWADAEENDGLALGVFAHCDKSGGEELNKELSELRSQAVFAMLTGKLGPFQEVAKANEWGTAECQAMLRALGCNAGAVDGIAGKMTAAAVQLFRREYNGNIFHEGVRGRAHGDLPDGDELDEATQEALVDAYHAEYSVAVPEARFWGPKHMGCGEFNPFVEQSSIMRDRRVTLVQYQEDRPREIDFPCSRGDASACAVDDGGIRRCRFYRETVEDNRIETWFPFWDLQWLQTPKGGAHLSALTILPDCDDLEFIVELQHTEPSPEDSDYGPPPPSRGVELARVPGMVRKGIAYAQWKPPAHYDPFDVLRWFEHVPSETERRFVLPEFQPPVFTIDGDDELGPVWGLGGAPGRELRHTRLDGEASGPATAIRNDGTLLWLEDISQLPNADEGQRIVALMRPGTEFEPVSS